MWQRLPEVTRHLTILALIPLIYGMVVTNLVIVLPPFLVQIAFTTLWFWTGYQFARFYRCSLKGILVGNALWTLSLLLFIWQFFLTNDANRSLFLAVVSQWYMHGFLWAGVKIVTAFLGNHLIGNYIMLASYLAMLPTFLAGFLTYVIYRSQDNRRDSPESF